MRSAKLALALAQLPAAMAPALDRIQRDQAAALPVIQPAFKVLREHLCAPDLSVCKLKEAKGVSPGRFSERFHAATGLNPADYIRALRIDVGCRLLATPEIPVATIGAMLGWVRHGSFHTIFRQAIGVTPTEFRKLKVAYAKSILRSPSQTPSAAAADTAGAMRPGVETMIQVGMGTADDEQMATTLAFLDREMVYRLGRRVDARGQRMRDRAFARAVWRLASQLDDPDAALFLGTSGAVVPEVFELLFEKTRTEGREHRRRGVRVAETALAAIDCMPVRALPAPALAELRVRAFTWLGNAHRLACDFRAAESAFSAAGAVLALLDPEQAPIGRAEYLDRKAALRWLESRFDEAHELATQAVPFSSACSPDQQVRMALQRAEIEAAKGDLRASCATLEAVSKRLASVEDAYLSTALWVNQAFRHLELGELEAAEAAVTQVREHARAKFAPELQFADGLLARHRGDRRRALADLEQASQGFRSKGDLYFAAVSALEAALVAAEMGARARASTLARQVISMLEAAAEPYRPMAALRILSTCAEHSDLRSNLAAALAALKGFGRHPLKVKGFRRGSAKTD